eukprot:3854396-Amphidinium_carterae.2
MPVGVAQPGINCWWLADRGPPYILLLTSCPGSSSGRLPTDCYALATAPKCWWGAEECVPCKHPSKALDRLAATLLGPTHAGMLAGGADAPGGARTWPAHHSAQLAASIPTNRCPALAPIAPVARPGGYSGCGLAAGATVAQPQSSRCHSRPDRGAFQVQWPVTMLSSSHCAALRPSPGSSLQRLPTG